MAPMDGKGSHRGPVGSDRSTARTPHGRGPSRAAGVRPVFLVSTTALARQLAARQGGLGAPTYSYHFAFECLRPALERLGRCEPLDDPARDLAAAAARLRSQGFQPIHLAMLPPPDVSPAAAGADVPLVLFPFWEFPDLPAEPLGGDARQDWTRTARTATAVLTAGRFTAGAFERDVPGVPVAVVPVPCPETLFETPAWEPGPTHAIECRHAVFGPAILPAAVAQAGSAVAPETPVLLDAPPVRGPVHRLASGTLTRLEPTLGPAITAALFRTGRLVRACRPRLGTVVHTLKHGGPTKLVFVTARAAYRGTLKQLLNDDAVRAITRQQHALMRRLGRDPLAGRQTLRPRTRLELGGIVFTSYLNLGDDRKNPRDLLSAFLHACRERADATLVLKLACRPGTVDEELVLLGQMLREVAPRSYACRVVAIADFLDDAAQATLTRATTWYASASHAEGACLPLMHAMASGRPAIAPAHTAMADYLDDGNALVVAAHPEPAPWPQDPSGRLRTRWYRIDWQSLHDAFRTALDLLDTNPGYASLAAGARRRMRAGYSVEATVAALREALARWSPPEPEPVAVPGAIHGNPQPA